MKSAESNKTHSYLSYSAVLPKYPDSAIINRELSEDQIVTAALIAWEENNRNPIRANDIYEVFGFSRRGREWDARTEYLSHQKIAHVLFKAGFVNVCEASNGGKRGRYAISSESAAEVMIV